MKLKLILIIAGLALAGSTVTIVVIQSKDHANQPNRAARWPG